MTTEKMNWIEEIDDILAEIECTVKGDEGDKITMVRGIINEQRIHDVVGRSEHLKT
jgi:hypothetical protein